MTWAFEFEDQPYFAGFRVLATNGIDLPVLNVFRMFGPDGGDRVRAEGDNAVPLEAILEPGSGTSPTSPPAASADGSGAVLVWNYHDDDRGASAADVTLTLAECRQGPRP